MIDSLVILHHGGQNYLFTRILLKTLRNLFLDPFFQLLPGLRVFHIIPGTHLSRHVIVAYHLLLGQIVCSAQPSRQPNQGSGRLFVKLPTGILMTALDRDGILIPDF